MCTKGGLRVNENCEVISTTGEIIPRLYASGNNSGIGGPGLFYNGAGGTLGPRLCLCLHRRHERRQARQLGVRRAGKALR